ncbi:MAG: aminopeptidase, partial [Clostridia bacterium]|nr:aminopeptidase [Clostridia bacterium]
MSDYKKIKEQLFYENKNAFLRLDEEEIKKAYDFCEGYKQFLNLAKTEREAASTAIVLAEQKGFKPFERDKKYKCGDKVYFNNRGKAVAFAVFGSQSAENGIKITAAHIDSPRLDIKPNPLYEDIELALFKTHYYGGIKKYQWTTVPFSLHGVFAKKDGSVLTV